MSYRCYCFPYVRCIRRLYRLCYVLQEGEAMATFVVAPGGQGNHAEMQVEDSVGGNGNVCCCALLAGEACEDAGKGFIGRQWQRLLLPPAGACFVMGLRLLRITVRWPQNAASKNYSLGDMAYRLYEKTFLRHNQRERPIAHKRLSTRVFQSTLTLRSRRRGW